MKNWQKNRNYKRVKDKDGNVVANIITVFGQDVKVSDEIFATYAQVDRRARYVGEDIPAQHELSLEQFEEEGVSLEKLIRETAPSAEESQRGTAVGSAPSPARTDRRFANASPCSVWDLKTA